MSKGNIVRQFSKKVIAFHPIYARLANNVLAGLFLSQAAYWSDRKEDGWFYKSQEQWTAETCLSRDQQETSRKVLVKMGVLKEKKEGLPYRLHFKVDFEALEEMVDGFNSCGLVCDDPTDWHVTIPQTNIEARAEDLNPKSTTESTNKDPYNPQGDGIAQEEFDLSIPSQATPKDPITEGFAEFWQEYPAGPRKADKPGTERAYRRALKSHTHDVIMAGLANAKGSHDWAKDDGEFIPGPSPFLNKEKFLVQYRPISWATSNTNGHTSNGTPPAPKPPPQRQYTAPEGSPEWYLDYVTAGMIPAHRQKFGWHKDENGEWDEARWRREHE